MNLSLHSVRLRQHESVDNQAEKARLQPRLWNRIPQPPESAGFGQRVLSALGPSMVPHSSPRVSHPNSAYLVKLYRLIDTAVALAVLLVIFMTANLYRTPNGVDEFLALRVTVKNLLLLGVLTAMWPQICTYFGLYDLQRISSLKNEISSVIRAGSVGSVLALLFPLTSKSGSFLISHIFYYWLGTITATVFVRYVIRTAIVYAPTRQDKIRHILIVGSGPRALKLYSEICTNPRADYEVIGFVDSHNEAAAPEVTSRKLGTLQQLEEILMSRVVDEVLIALPIKSRYIEVQNAIRTCEKIGVESKYLSDIFQYSLAKPRYEQREHLSVVTMKVVNDDYRLIIKRMIDIVGALCGLIILSPLMLLVVIAIKFTSKGPVFFAQHRHGLNKRRFRMYKFRTMVIGAEALQSALEGQNEVAGPVFKIKDDPRVTRIGKFLRKASIDELPQLINVLRGDMSLVGPRPLPDRDVSKFSEAWLMRRFSVKPGLTCLWQVSGRSNLGFDRWVELDLKYIDDWSLGLDLRILAKTVPAVLKGAGAV